MEIGSGPGFIWEISTEMTRKTYHSVRNRLLLLLCGFVLITTPHAGYLALSKLRAYSPPDGQQPIQRSVPLPESAENTRSVWPEPMVPEPQKFTLQASANWDEQRLHIELSVPIERLGLQTRYYVSSVIESNLSVWLHDATRDLQVNSQQTLRDYWGNNILKSPHAFFKNILRKEHSVFYPDLKSFRSTYEIRLYPDLVQIWVNENFQREELPPAILQKDATEFSGLIIYVDQQLPIRGEGHSRASLQAALFPRIYDKKLKLLLNYRNVEKDALLQRGMLRYDMADSDAEARHRELIGSYPLRIVAEELFGLTDLIISNTNAAAILENPYLRDALRQGRILILSRSKPATVLRRGLQNS